MSEENKEKYLTLYKEQPWDIRKTYDYVFHAKARERVTELLRAIAKRGDPERSLDIGRCRRHDAIFVNGGRGVGKTVFLTQADTFLGKEEKLYFLPVLEPSLLDDTVSSPERFISVAVAQVNEVLEEKHPYAGSEDGDRSALLDEYGKAYRDVAAAISGVQSFTKRDGSGADDLFSMQSVISLERALHRFFGVACRMLNVKALILRFDDVDMACGIGFCVLESIRKYLATPYVVPMVSGDLSLYQRLCENHFREKLGAKENPDSGKASCGKKSSDSKSSESEKEDVEISEPSPEKMERALAESYLQKVLPADRRVELHALGYGMASGEIQIDGVRLVEGTATTEMKWEDAKACLDFYAFGAMKNERFRRDALPDSVEHKECFRGAEKLSIPLELPSTRAAFMFLSRIFDVLKAWNEGGERSFSWERFRIFHEAARDVTEHVKAFEARQEAARVNALASADGKLSVSEIFRNLNFEKTEPSLKKEDARLFVSRRRSNPHYQELKTFLEQSISEDKDKEKEKERYKRFLWDLFLTNEYDSAGKLKPSILLGGRFFEFVLSSIYFGEKNEGVEALMVRQLISKVPFNSGLKKSLSFEERFEEESPEKDLSHEEASNEESSKGNANNRGDDEHDIFCSIGSRLRLCAEENFKKLPDSFLIAKIAKRYFDNLKSIHDDFVLKIDRAKKLELCLVKLKDGKATLERTISEEDLDLEKQKEGASILEKKILENRGDVERLKKEFLVLEKAISKKNADLEKSASEKSALEKKIQKNNAELKSLDKKKDGVEGKIWKTRSELDGLENEDVVLEKKIQKSKADMEGWKKEKGGLDEEVQKGELDLVELVTEMSVLKGKIQKNRADMRRLEKEKAALDKMLQKKKSALEKLENEEAVLKKQANENSALEEKIQKNKAEMEELEKEEIALEKTVQKGHSDLEKLENEKGDSEKKIQKKKVILNGLRKKKIVLEKTIQKWLLNLEKRDKEKESLEKKIWGKSADLNNLENQKVSVEGKIKDKKALLEKQEGTNEVLWKRIQEESAKLLESRSNKTEMEKKIQKEASLLETLEKNKVDSEKKILKNKEDLETQKKKKSDLENEIQETSDLEAKIQKEIALMSFIRRCSAALLNAVAEVETLESESVSRNIATEASDVGKIKDKDLAWRRNVHPLLNKDSLTYLVSRNPLIFSVLKVYESLNEEKEYLENETEEGKIFKEIFPTFEKIFVGINPASASSAAQQKDGGTTAALNAASRN